MALGKVVDKRFCIVDKLQKLEVKQFALNKAICCRKGKICSRHVSSFKNIYL